MNRRSYIALTFILVFLAICGFAITKRQFIKDYFIVTTTDVSTEANAIAKTIKLTADGQFLYEASQADVQDASQFQQSCSGVEQQNIVLGCYSNQRIFIYDVSDKRLNGIKEVTAAHELLHATYERLSSDEKKDINKLLKQQRAKLTDAHVKETLALYKNVSQAELYNEMYAIFGTEVKKLSPALEKHYAQFFTKRSTIVAYADKYQSVFRNLQDDYDQLKAQYDSYDAQKKGLEQQLGSLQTQIEQKQAELDRLRTSNVSAYNQQVPVFNSLVAQYNVLVAQYKALIAQMNSLIEELNKNSTELNQLNKEIDSRYQSI